MGQKVHPKIIRIGINRDWSSKWFSDKEYAKFLLEDYKIRTLLNKKHRNAGISDIEITRWANDAKVIIHTSKPGILIGRGGLGIEEIRKEIEKTTKRKTGVVIEEVDMPENHAVLIARNVADQIEKRIPYRRAVKQVLENTMKSGIRGARIRVSGRLNGSDIARSEAFSQGKIPLSSLREDIDFAHVPAQTTYGIIGVKAWIYRKEKKEKQGINE